MATDILRMEFFDVFGLFQSILLLRFCIVLGGTIGDVSVSWRVSQSTATPAEDYTASGGTVNFGPGETRQGKLLDFYFMKIVLTSLSRPNNCTFEELCFKGRVMDQNGTERKVPKCYQVLKL